METMQIRWLGHSCFAITCQEYTVVVDPFAPGSVPGYADIQETADQVLCSHEHHDHNYRAGVTLRQDGRANPFTITSLPSFHDDCGGEKRGPNTIHLLEAGGLRVAHLGDLGALPAPEVVEQLQNLDAVLVPVGGFYTVGPQEAWEVVQALSPPGDCPHALQHGHVRLRCVGAGGGLFGSGRPLGPVRHGHPGDSPGHEPSYGLAHLWGSQGLKERPLTKAESQSRPAARRKCPGQRRAAGLAASGRRRRWSDRPVPPKWRAWWCAAAHTGWG